jgi:KipI family sensor histidine kinase inhibitor
MHSVAAVPVIVQVPGTRRDGAADRYHDVVALHECAHARKVRPTGSPMIRPGTPGDDACAIQDLGDRALLLRWSQTIDGGLNDRVHACAEHLSHEAPPWVQSLVPAYASLAVVLNVDLFPAGAPPQQQARAWLQRALAGGVDAAAAAHRVVEVPVRYGGDDGPDLPQVAEHAGVSESALIELHAAPLYRVAMLGFAPGFPYLLGLDARLAMPRLEVPRLHVPAGSVGIGGEQTGIYPQAGPGGWRLIGRTSLSLFDPASERPTLLRPGDRLRFVPLAAGRI